MSKRCGMVNGFPDCIFTGVFHFPGEGKLKREGAASCSFCCCTGGGSAPAENRLEKTWQSLRREGRTALMPFIMSGDPSLEATREHVLKAVEAGTDIVELGVPSSDALADGPVVQDAAGRALAAGVTPQKVLEMVAQLRQETEVPLVLMCYYNQLLQAGEGGFIREIRKSGGDGLIVPDLPLEESDGLRRAAAEESLSFITMVTPLSGLARSRQIAGAGSGFLYCVSVAGVTGARRNIPVEALEMLKTLREITSLPLALGFGISSPQQAREAAGYADGVIVGSALIRGMEGKSRNERLEFIETFLASLRSALGPG